jgi:hypothetical protein
VDKVKKMRTYKSTSSIRLPVTFEEEEEEKKDLWSKVPDWAPHQDILTD